MYKLDQGQIELVPLFDMRSPYVGLKDWGVFLQCVSLNNQSTFFDNIGHGVIHSPPHNHDVDTPPQF